MCAENNMVWPKLTVDDHLDFIGGLSGFGYD